MVAARRSELARYRRYVAQEFDRAVLYRHLAARAEDEQREVLLELAAAEERHARADAATWTPSGRYGAVASLDGRIGTETMPGVFAQIGMEYAL